MPAITCPKCPTRLKVPDGATGNVRCPKCGAVFPASPQLIPSFEVTDEPPAPKPKAPAPPKKAAVKAEEPDFEVVDEKPKKRVKAAVEEDEDDEDDRPRKKKKRDDDEDDEPKAKKRYRDDDEDDDEDYQPRKKKKKRRSGGGGMVFALLGVGLALLLLVGGLIWMFWPSGGTANVKYLPDNSKVIASVKVEELLNSGAYKQIKAEFPKFEKDFESDSEFGLSLNDISSVLVGGGGDFDSKPNFVAVIQTNKAVKAEDIISKFKDNKPTNETVGSYTIYTRGTVSFCVAESKVVLFGDSDSLRAVLKRDGKPKLSDGMKAAMKEADFSKTIAVAIDIKDLMPKGGKGRPNRGGMPFGGQEANEFAKDIEGFGGWISVKSDIESKFTAIFRDSKGANDAKTMIDAAIVMLKKGKDVPPEAAEMIDKTEIRVSGNRLEMSGRIDVSKILKLAKTAGGKF